MRILAILTDGGTESTDSTTRHYECRQCGLNLGADADECSECGGSVAIYTF
jgi:ribosomal protein L37E